MSKYVSYSMLSSIKCPMYYRYVYIDKVYPVEKPVHFVAGSIWHECVHMYFEGVNKKKILKHASKSFSVYVNRVSSKADYRQQLGAIESYTRAALRGYFKLYDRKEFKVVATEKKFALLLNDKIMLGGVIDRIVEDKHGDVWVMEHKFTTQMDRDYVVRTALDQQVSIYFWAALKMGLKPKGIIYDMAKKPYKKPLQSETMLDYETRMVSDYKLRPEFYFKREELHRDNKQIEDLTKDVVKKVRRLNFMVAKELYDKESSHCGTYGLCEYFPLCTNPKSAKNKILFKHGGRE